MYVACCNTYYTSRKPIVKKFPSLISSAMEFIKLNGYSAHARRRSSTGSGAGVSLDQVRNHLLQTVPGLKEHGIGKTAVAYLFCPPNKGRKSSARYKGYIDARVPAKRNNVRKKNVDAHYYMFSRVKIRREMAQKFNEEFITVSCDNMNKLNVGGGMMVSRYHQINRLYMNDDTPNYEDHDFNLPGYKIVASGYMMLEFNENVPIEQQDSSGNVYTEVDFNIELEPLDELKDMLIEEDVSSVVNNMIDSISKNNAMFKEGKFIKDSSGRLHYKTPHAGPGRIVLRPMKYQQSNIVAHIGDLEPLVNTRRNEKRNCVLLMVDGGPDWSTSSYKNIYCFYRWWRAQEFDLLSVTSYTAGFSAYNSIEHLWSPVSKRFTGVKANYCANGDSVAPALLTGTSNEEKEAKEHEVFDRITKEIQDDYLKELTFNNNPIMVERVACDNPTDNDNYGIHKVEKFFKEPIHVARSPEYKDIMKQFRDLFDHQGLFQALSILS